MLQFLDKVGKDGDGAAKVKTPSYDYATVALNTRQNPRWLHFGVGNIFRAYIARLQQDLLNQGKSDAGIIAAESYDYEIVEKVYRPYKNLALVAVLKPNGEIELEFVASIAEAIRCDQQTERLREIVKNPSLQIISLCITEKGYSLTDMAGKLLKPVEQAIAKGPELTNTKNDPFEHTMPLVASLLLERFRAGAAPVALLSLDNCSHNGEKLRNSVLTVARAWEANGFLGDGDKAFLSYLEDENRVSFPWSMIDKITPRPSERVREYLTKEIGLVGDMDPLVTAKGTFIAPFVNTEAPEYLVVEDRFPGGRPPLEDAGVYFTDRETVNNAERMKVTTCLNPLHTALAVTGCLLGYASVAAEMENPLLKTLVEKIGYAEGLPVVVNPGIFNPRDFLREVLEVRIPNPFIGDTPQRIATDTSQKVPIRYGEVIKTYMERPDKDPKSLVGIPLAIAAWFRYLLGVDDQLRPMELSRDPMLEELQKGLEGVRAGAPESYQGQLRSFLKNPTLFAVDLFEAGLGEKVEGFFVKMLTGKDAVRQTLAEALQPF